MREVLSVMALIFATLCAALAALLAGPGRLAAALLLACLAMSLGLFLFEIHSPQDGFRMPWLQVRASAPGGAA